MERGIVMSGCIGKIFAKYRIVIYKGHNDIDINYTILKVMNNIL